MNVSTNPYRGPATVTVGRGLLRPLLCTLLLLTAPVLLALDNPPVDDEPAEADVVQSAPDQRYPDQRYPGQAGQDLLSQADLSLLQQRELFKLALLALDGDDRTAFDQMYERLNGSGYPLIRYLDYRRIRALIDQIPDQSVVKLLGLFEQTHNDKALSRNLTRFLQKRLIEEESWPIYLDVSASDLAAKQPCALAQARSVVDGKISQWDDSLLSYWQRTPVLPELCAALFEQLREQKSPPIAAIWERIYTSIDKGKLDVAREMATWLSSADRKRVLDWVGARAEPSAFLQSDAVAKDDLLNRRILLDLVIRWSWLDPEAAHGYWLQKHGKYSFFDDERYEVARELALRGGWRVLPDAHEWLYSFEVRDEDLEVREWRVRTALREQDWQKVLKSLAELPLAEQKEDHWAYWEARAEAELGNTDKAEQIYQEIALLPTYHGFLAADRLGLNYRIVDSGIAAEKSTLARLAQNEGLIRAREYLLTGLLPEGRREWSAAIEELDQADKAASALLATRWNLPDRAIASANAAKEKAALAMRFPIVFEQRVMEAADKYSLEPTLIYGVIRRESAFIEDIRSSAGAVGLMQLMPKTAKYVSGLMGRGKQPYELTDPGISIEFGSFYLRHVMDQFSDHPALAASSYNAGPHRTRSWLPQLEPMPADVWIDTIPFTETRRYVRAVLAYGVIFEWRLQNGMTRILARIGDQIDAVEVEADASGSSSQ